MTAQLIASPYPDGYVIVKPGHEGGVRIGEALYGRLRDAPASSVVPDWFVKGAHDGFGIDVSGKDIGGTVLVRPETPHGYARASYELNLGCNFDCIH